MLREDMRVAKFERETEERSLRRFVKQLEKPENSVASLIAEALDKTLTPRQKQMITMYYIDGLTMRQIAAALEVNPSTVTRTLQIARAKLEVAFGYCKKVLVAAEEDEEREQ